MSFQGPAAGVCVWRLSHPVLLIGGAWGPALPVALPVLAGTGVLLAVDPAESPALGTVSGAAAFGGRVFSAGVLPACPSDLWAGEAATGSRTLACRVESVMIVQTKLQG